MIQSVKIIFIPVCKIHWFKSVSLSISLKKLVDRRRKSNNIKSISSHSPTTVIINQSTSTSTSSTLTSPSHSNSFSRSINCFRVQCWDRYVCYNSDYIKKLMMLWLCHEEEVGPSSYYTAFRARETYWLLQMRWRNDCYESWSTRDQLLLLLWEFWWPWENEWSRIKTHRDHSSPIISLVGCALEVPEFCDASLFPR